MIMKRMLNRMLRYADAIVKRGIDKLIDAIGQSPEPQSKNTETPQPQKRMATTLTAHRKQLTTLRTAVLPLWTNSATLAIMCLTARPKCNGATRRIKGLCP